jgi:O-6-methylguanine DNA methyltransferase
MLQLINLNELRISPETLQTSYLQTEVGYLKVVWCEEGIFSSEFVDDAPKSDPFNDSPFLRFLRKHQNQLPLIVQATEFQKSVWLAVSNSRAGQCFTYKTLAMDMGKPDAVRAVGSALGKNQHALFIPCHRAIRSDGGLGGFRWGLERKSQLLRLEADGLNFIGRLLS